MKAYKVGLWSIWLYGLMLIGVSLFLSQKLPSLKSEFKRPSRHYKLRGGSANPRVTIFSAPRAFIGTDGATQSQVIRSWLALSPQIRVVLFSQDPSVVAFAGAFNSQVLVENDIDFTFLGTPFLHSMIARSLSYTSDISVLVDPETILLPDFISTLNYAYELDHDWLLVAALRNISPSHFYYDESARQWRGKDGKLLKTQNEMLGRKWQSNRCEGKVLLAWNNGNIPLHRGVLPPFLHGRGVHNNWLINEAIASEWRFVFDASWTVSSFYLDDLKKLSDPTVGASNISNIRKQLWEFTGNSHFGALYGSSFHPQVDYSNLLKLVMCAGQYTLVNTAEKIVFPHRDWTAVNFQTRHILRSRRKKKIMACVNGIKSLEREFDCFSKNQTTPSSPLELPFSLEALLDMLSDENKTIVLAVAGYNYKDMLMSWVCRLRHLHISNFLISALDQETYQFSVLQGLPVIKNPFAPKNISFDDCHFGTKCFQRVTKVKSRMVLKILKLGYNVLLSDVDVYWFENPIPILHSFGPGVLVAQSDEYKKTGPINLPRRLNSGFYFARSDNVTIAAMEKVVRHAAMSDLSEQPSFYDTLCGEDGSNRVGDDRCVEHGTNLTVKFLDRDLFPNGAYRDLWQERNVKAACRKIGCLVLHNNWISGRQKKLERQVSSGLWQYDMSSRMCLQSWQKASSLGLSFQS